MNGWMEKGRREGEMKKEGSEGGKKGRRKEERIALVLCTRLDLIKP